MAKKSSGVSKTSKGIHSTVSASILKAVRLERTPAEDMLNKMKAYAAGRNPWLTIDNPDPKQRNRRKIRVRANEFWGSPKERVAYSVYGGNGDQKKKGAK